MSYLRFFGRICGVKIKCLTIRQPWAWLIVKGHKPVENRVWSTHYRGWIAIHAGKARPSLDKRIAEWLQEELRVVVPDKLDLGKIVGFARISDCVTEHSSDFFTGPFGFVFDRVIPFDGPFVTGRLGFFTLELSDSVNYPPAIQEFVLA